MRKRIGNSILLLPLVALLSGCSGVGDKSMEMSIIYAVAAILSLALLIGYCTLIRKRMLWFVVLFASVFVVNVGYFALSVSDTLQAALWANRLSYLGSVFLPLSMLMIVLQVSKLSWPKWLPRVLLAVSVLMFLIAASPGILDIYYKDVSLELNGGVAVLKKTYGPLHSLYLYYLLLHFGAILGLTIFCIAKKRVNAGIQVMVLAVAVTVNIGVWLLEQLVKIDFEILSVSYIISELFLLSLSLMIQENEKLLAAAKDAGQLARREVDTVHSEMETSCNYLLEQLPRLTYTERLIYDLYLQGKSTKEVLQEMNIKENTLKYHNKNIYGKLGVSSRKQLLETARQAVAVGKESK